MRNKVTFSIATLTLVMSGILTLIGMNQHDTLSITRAQASEVLPTPSPAKSPTPMPTVTPTPKPGDEPLPTPTMRPE